MIQTIYVQTTKGNDAISENILSEIRSRNKKNKVSKIKTINIYRLEDATKKDAKVLAEKLFCENINQKYSLNKYSESGIKIEIGYKRGVMNPQVASIKKAASDLGIRLREVDTATMYVFKTSLNHNDFNMLFKSLNLYNPLVEEVITTSPTTLGVKPTVETTQKVPIRKMKDSDLVELSRDTLFLNLDEMKAIKKYFKKLERDPTDCELEVLAQTWSEHCVHKTFKANLIIDGKKKKPLFARIKSTAKHKKNIVSAFVDNSGVIDFYDGYAICGKVETHNSPSAIEPYGGAMTGSGGVFRDILGTGKGAKPVVSTDVFCLGHYNMPQKLVPPGCLHPRYTLNKVIQGVRDYGNRVGIPTNNGSLHFHNDFRAKPTVAVGAYGLIPKKASLKSTLKKGFLLLTLGGKTGRDGIHGATFSSASMTDQTHSTLQTAVQIGNAIEEKRVIDLVLKLRDKDLIQSITDCGAGGYSSAIGEMAKDTGANVYLDQVPLKYPGLSPWEIFLSESQERMVIAIKPEHLTNVKKISKMFNVESCVIGEVTDSLSLKVFYKTELVCDLAMNFLHNGLPQKTLVGKSPKKEKIKFRKKEEMNLDKAWKKILSHPSVASKESILRMYDHNVKGSNALHPFSGVHFDGPNDASIVRPLLDKPYGLIVSHGLNPILTQKDPYWGSVWAIAEAVSNYVSVGGDLRDAALIDNFIWPTPDPESLYSLDRSVDACTDMSDVLGMPFVSGKDSLSSTYRFPDGKILKIPPVLLISVFGKIPDVEKTVSQDFKKIGSKIYLVGRNNFKNMSGSIYSEISSSPSRDIPRVDIENLRSTLQSVTKAIRNGSILSCHDISEGGMITAISEMSFGADFGAAIDIRKIKHKNPNEILFNETSGTFIVEMEEKIDPNKIFTDIPFIDIGYTTSEKEISIKRKNNMLVSEKISSLKYIWKKPFEEIFS